MRIPFLLSTLLLSTLLQAESIEESLDGFDDIEISSISSTQQDTITNASNEEAMEGFDDISAMEESNTTVAQSEEGFFSYFSGRIVQQGAISYNDTRPQNVFGSLRQTLWLNYERKFENGLKVKVNGRAFYDPMYDVSNADYYPAEVDSLNSEVLLFEAYVEWSLLENLDARWGRQVVVWGRSDTIRVTDILNPIDNRRPGYQDLEDLYLPRGMLKFDYQYGNWRISPIVVLEQRFTLDPPYGSIYNPFTPPVTYNDWTAAGNPTYTLENESYSQPTFALSVGGEFEGWDVNFYASRLYEDRGYIPLAQLPDRVLNKKYTHNKTNMFGTAINVVYDEWLFKTELAYFNNLTYTATQDRGLSRMDALLGFEYSGIADTTISYDIALRHFNEYDPRLFVPEENYLEQDTYQQALRINSNFLRDTLHANYLVSMFGKNFDEGGFQRAWMDYEVADGINTEIGIVDYFGGTPLFDLVQDQMVLFMDMSYHF